MQDTAHHHASDQIGIADAQIDGRVAPRAPTADKGLIQVQSVDERGHVVRQCREADRSWWGGRFTMPARIRHDDPGMRGQDRDLCVPLQKAGA